MKEFNKLKSILEREVTPAIGCTEPVAVALSAATAIALVGGRCLHIKITVSSNIYKNAMAVGIPGTDKVGIDVAAALGVFGGDASKGLQVLCNVEKGINQALAFVSSGNVKVDVINKAGVYVDCIVTTDEGEGRCVIEDSHTNIVIRQKNGITINTPIHQIKEDNLDDKALLINWLKNLKIAEILSLVRKIPFSEIHFMLAGRDMNLAVAKLGIEHRKGMGVGHLSSKRNIHSIEGYVATLTAAGADVRMAGEKIPVMSSAGSGNHGITSILPVVAVAEKLNKSEEDLARALALSHLITVYIKSYTGKLTPLCGCAVAAGIGASTGIAYLMGGELYHLEGTIKNMVANITGMICDGGKVGCALKLYNAAATAYTSAQLAMEGSIVPSDNGIIHESVEQTIKNIGKLSYQGMEETDKVILEIMMENKQMNYCS